VCSSDLQSLLLQVTSNSDDSKPAVDPGINGFWVPSMLKTGLDFE
jgi:hypothetical protein